MLEHTGYNLTEGNNIVQKAQTSMRRVKEAI